MRQNFSTGYQRRNRKRKEERGTALILVIAFLALLSALVVGFFSRVSGDLNNARSYSEGATVKHLADSALSVVMSQIRAATTVGNGAWGSQPGMIRVYRGADGKAGESADSFYKLYSSHDLVVSRQEMGDFKPWENDPGASSGVLEAPLGAGGYRDQAAHFVDMNQAVRVPLSGGDGGRGEGGFAWRYPIFDPEVAGLHTPGEKDPNNYERKWKVEGAAISLPVGLREAAPSGESGRVSNEAPMPVRWIYVLKDGTLTAPEPIRGAASVEEGAVAKWGSKGADGTATGVPTKENPIIGRIAFWTDDESSKVNINTAGGHIAPPGFDEDINNVESAASYAGSFWDTPRVQTLFDRGVSDGTTGKISQPGLAVTQPNQGEYQRYPGHPATTSLGLVLKNLLPTGNGLDSEKLYRWLPRIAPGGSIGGLSLSPATAGAVPIKSGITPDANGKTYHLFNSLDDMLYTSESGPRKEARSELSLSANSITPELLDRLRFFLTAHSRAPELNLFGRPRVNIWPTYPLSEQNKLNGTDYLMRFCSTIGAKPNQREFIFQRSNPYNGTADYNISRNRQIISYLQNLTSKTDGKIPGWGGSFEEKYEDSPGGRNQILTEIFDYIRTVNLRDSTKFNVVSVSSLLRGSFTYAPKAIVVPTKVTVGGVTTTGFGRYPTVIEAALVFYHAGWKNASGQVSLKQFNQLASDGFVPTHKLVRAFILFRPFNAMQGFTGIGAIDPSEGAFQTISTNAVNFTIQAPGDIAKTLTFPNSSQFSYTSGAPSLYHGRNWGGSEQMMHTLANSVANNRAFSTYYGFQTDGEGVSIPISATEFNFTGATMNVDLRFGTSIIRKLVLNFPSSTNWPLPTEDLWNDKGGFDPAFQSPAPTHPRFSGNLNDAANARAFTTRLVWSRIGESDADLGINAGSNYSRMHRQFLQPGDTIRSLVLGGKGADEALTDPRLASLKAEVDVFRPHPDYHTNLSRAAEMKFTTINAYFTTGMAAQDSRINSRGVDPVGGKLVNTNLSYNGKAPDVALNILAKRLDGKAADFDTGIGNEPDGGYASKPDEGNIKFDSGGFGYWEPYFAGWSSEDGTDTYFSPNRQIPSPVMFGSLLSRPQSNRGWETLCFSPNPAGENHPGQNAPPDHLLLDLYHMAVVEPYAISEPFSIAGRVNLNYQMAPFNYIERSTGLRAALQSLRVTAIPQSAVSRYKHTNNTENWRYLVDRNETLKGFDGFFEEYKTDRNKGFFKSASQICERFLYPRIPASEGSSPKYGTSAELGIRAFWSGRALSGDNVREKPYADLYPRVTTKSNTYTVHYRVQTLRQKNRRGGSNEEEQWRTWDERSDKVLAEYRGHTTIERYLDPLDGRFNKNATNPINVETQSLEDAYRFRIIDNKRFSPW